MRGDHDADGSGDDDDDDSNGHDGGGYHHPDRTTYVSRTCTHLPDLILISLPLHRERQREGQR